MEQIDGIERNKLFTAMLENQANLNATAYSETWSEKAISREFDYCLAGAQEVAEFINSFGYSWWSKPKGNMVTEPLDASNCKTEIIDAVHFMLSQTIANRGGDIATAAREIEMGYGWAAIRVDMHGTRDWSRLLGAQLLVENIGTEFVIPGAPAWGLLFATAQSMGFSLQNLYARYIGKSVLNAFRQKNGYKEGTYQKMWDGVSEDNYFLAEWIDSLETIPLKEEIEVWIAESYATYTL